jgi:uncharacterized membrane protein YvbJ
MDENNSAVTSQSERKVVKISRKKLINIGVSILILIVLFFLLTGNYLGMQIFGLLVPIFIVAFVVYLVWHSIQAFTSNDEMLRKKSKRKIIKMSIIILGIILLAVLMILFKLFFGSFSRYY